MAHHLDVDLGLAGRQVLSGPRPRELTGSCQDGSTLQRHLRLDEHSLDIRRRERADAEGSSQHLPRTNLPHPPATC